MAETTDGLQDSFMDPALARMGRIENAFNHIAKVIHLELADIALNPSLLDDEKRVQLQTLGKHLVQMSGSSYELLTGISLLTGDAIVDTPQLPLAPKKVDTQSDSLAFVPLHHPSPNTLPQPSASPAGERTHKPSKPVANSSNPEVNMGQSELYEAIIEPSRLPEVHLNGDGRAIEVVVTGMNKIKIGERQLLLKGHDLFVFNALLLLRDKARAASEIRELGFYPEATRSTAQVAFSNSIKNISLLLNKAAGIELVKKVGKARSTRYCVNPNLVLVDQREAEQQPNVQTPDAGVTQNLKKN